MAFLELLRQVLGKHSEGMTPQQLRDYVKANHPDFYGTDAHRRNVEKGHYHDLDHALLAQIYVASRSGAGISVDRSTKPIKLSLAADAFDGMASSMEDSIDSENLEKLEAGVARYTCSVRVFTRRMVKRYSRSALQAVPSRPG